METETSTAPGRVGRLTACGGGSPSAGACWGAPAAPSAGNHWPAADEGAARLELTLRRPCLRGWLLPGGRSGRNPGPTSSQRTEICQQDRLCLCKKKTQKTFLLALFSFSVLPALCSSLAEGAPQPSSHGPPLRWGDDQLQGPFGLHSWCRGRVFLARAIIRQ